MVVSRHTDEQPAGRVNDGDRTAPSITATLIGRRLTVDRIMHIALGCNSSVMLMGVRAAGAVVRMLVLRGRSDRRTVMSGRLRMARSGDACESKRNGNSQDDDSAALHGIRP